MAKILIIGGGVAGLSAGIFSKLNGHQVTVCESHAIAGGNLTGWDRKGYHIDNCIHWLTGTNPNSDNYQDWVTVGALGGVEVYQSDALYTCERVGRRLSLKRNLAEFEHDLITISPFDRLEIDRLISAVKLMQGIFNVGGVGKDQKATFLDLVKGAHLLARYFTMTTGQLAMQFKHPLIQDFINCFLGENFGALAFIVVVANYCGDNGGIPKGASLEMAKRITNKFLSLGGNLLLQKRATKLLIASGKVRGVEFADGEIITADYVIVTCDPRQVFGKMTDLKMPRALARQYNDKRKQRFSSIHCAFACDTTNLPFSNDFMFEMPFKEQDLLKSKFMIVREFTHEKDFAPEGKTVVQSLTFCGEDMAKEFINLAKNKGEYALKKKEICQRVLGVIEEKFPMLKGLLTPLDVWTPATYERFVGSQIGSWMSFTFPSKNLPVTLPNRVKGVSNLILATQWLQSPGGLPIALSLGKKAVNTIEVLEGKKASKGVKQIKRRKSAYA